MTIPCFVVAIWVLLNVPNLHAKPVVTQVTGALTNGSIVTLNGESFAAHPDYNTREEYIVSAWDNMESGLADTMTFISVYGQELVHSAAFQRYGSKFCGRGYRWSFEQTYSSIFGKNVTSTYMYGATHTPELPAKVLFVSGWFMFQEGFYDGINFQSGDLDQTKFLMLAPPDSDYAGQGGPKTYFQTRAGTVVPLRTETEDGDLSESHGALNIWSPEGEWHRFDIYVNLNQPDGFKIHEWYVDGKKVVRSHEYYNEIAVPERFTSICFLGYQYAGDDNYTWFQYCDDMYVDCTQARIEISDKNIWSSTEARHNELQIPVSWNDAEIKFRFNQGSFRSNDAVYLFVIDENGIPSDPYPLSVADDSVAPGTPANLILIK